MKNSTGRFTPSGISIKTGRWLKWKYTGMHFSQYLKIVPADIAEVDSRSSIRHPSAFNEFLMASSKSFHSFYPNCCKAALI